MDAVHLISDSSAKIGKLNGDFRLIVILVEFTDIKHKTSRETIHNLIFRSMNKYWRDVSYHQFNVIGDSVGWLSIGRDEAYYGKDTDPKQPGSDQKVRELIADSCEQAKDVDFGRYQDIMVVFAGHGQDSVSENSNLLWPQATGSELDVTCGSKTFNSGGYAPEFVKDGPLELGAFTHEFAHTIGLPDLYDSAPDVSCETDFVGEWSLMACGSWGGHGISPVGLESWSRIKLGWLSSASVPMTEDGFAQQLNLLEDATGPRALKIPTTDGKYYLFEARAKLGLDQYLPDTGVLITHIDESKESGKGIVEVINCHLGIKSIDDATCKVDEAWSDPSNNIYMRVLKRQGAGYVIALASKPITTMKDMYSAEVSLIGLASGVSVSVAIDDTDYATITVLDRLTVTFLGLAGSTHTVTLSQCVLTREDARSCTSDNTVAIGKPGAYVINYDVREVRLLIEVDPSTVPGTDEKWLAVGDTMTLGPYDEVIPVDAGTRFSLVGLAIDGTSAGEKTLTLRMDQPHTVTVRYVTQYFLRIVTDFGDPKGQGWYNSSDLAMYSVTTPQGFMTRQVFVSWAGDITSTEPQGTLTMTRPYTIEARWRSDYAQVAFVLVLVVSVIAAVLLTVRRKRQQPTSPGQIRDSTIAIPRVSESKAERAQ